MIGLVYQEIGINLLGPDQDKEGLQEGHDSLNRGHCFSTGPI